MSDIQKSRTYTKQVFPDRLRNLRNAIGISQEEFAKALEVSRAAIGYYESNDSDKQRLPDIDFLAAVSSLTGCNIEYLLGYSDNMAPAPPSYAELHDLSDEQYIHLEELLECGFFKAFLSKKETVEYFNYMDEAALLQVYGLGKRACDIVEYKTISMLGAITKQVYLSVYDSMISNPGEAYSKIRDNIISALDNINLNESKEKHDDLVDQIISETKAACDAERKELVEKAKTDPILKFRLMLSREETKNNGQETR